MSIEIAEKLKSELTDRYVVVEEGVAELQRFVGRTGLVKTVNMNGKAIIQFDGGEDISWYDIDPSFLKVVDKPEPAPKKEVAKEAPPAEKESAAPTAKKKSAGLSPLEQARQQGAGGAKTEAAPALKAEAKKPAESGKKLSPLEQARMQDAGGAKTEATPAPKAETKQAVASGKKLSPLEQARIQDAGGAKTTETEAVVPETSEPEVAEEKAAEDVKTEPAAEEKPQKSDTPTTGPDGKQLSPLELARLQGPFKG